MTFDREVFYINEDSLVRAFGQERRDFDEVVEILASSPDEALQIKEYVHFIIQGYVAKKQAIRIFSQEGAIAIASYLDINGKIDKTAIDAVLSLIEQYRIERLDTQIRRSVYENSSSLIQRNDRHWLAREEVIKIFRTSRNKLSSVFKHIQESGMPMIEGVDFDNLYLSFSWSDRLVMDYLEEDSQITRSSYFYFSLSGLERLSVELSKELRTQERREYCQRVGEVAPPILKFLALTPSPSDQEIKRTVQYVKNKDRRCQITGVCRDKYENRRVKLVGHHLYDRKTYAFLASDPDNIIAIDELVSDDFHQWNGGNHVSCTIDDFIDYVEWKYPQKHEAILMLLNRRRVLLLKLSQFQRALPEGQ